MIEAAPGVKPLAVKVWGIAGSITIAKSLHSTIAVNNAGWNPSPGRIAVGFHDRQKIACGKVAGPVQGPGSTAA